MPSATTRLLTVIIPAHNASLYIEKCISSLLIQPAFTHAAQAIVVIDGNEDETFDAAKRAIFGHEESVRLFVQKQSGPGAARNHGLTQVETEYVTFLDADDTWHADYLDTLLPLLVERPDIIEYDASLIDKYDNHLGILKIAIAATGSTNRITRENFISRFRCYAWARVYRTELAHAHLFPTGCRFEDNATTPWHYWHSRLTLSVGHALVAYRQHPHSILSTPHVRDIDEIVAAGVEAAAMYQRTGDIYWQLVAYRIFQFACRRTTWLPVFTWPKSVRTARMAIAGVSAPGIAHWAQAHFSFPYLTWLYFQRRFIHKNPATSHSACFWRRSST